MGFGRSDVAPANNDEEQNKNAATAEKQDAGGGGGEEGRAHAALRGLAASDGALAVDRPAVDRLGRWKGLEGDRAGLGWP